MPDRRSTLKVLGMAAIVGLHRFQGQTVTSQITHDTENPSEPYQLPPLPYEADALEPYIDAQTMHLHHEKHHAAYVKNLNTALVEHHDLTKVPVEELIRHLERVPESIRMAVRNNGGGHVNHSFFWQTMQKNSPGQPRAELGKAIDRRFGSFSAFQEEFKKAALSIFGSGWAWLSLDGSRQLLIETSPNQDSPWMAGRTPILGVDVWEHAYYLKYQNFRADYVKAFFNVISWDSASRRWLDAMQQSTR